MSSTKQARFVCYDNNTPFRSEGCTIYGPLRQKNSKTGEVRVSKYECFICECDNEVMADAIVFYLNDAWQIGKMQGEGSAQTELDLDSTELKEHLKRMGEIKRLRELSVTSKEAKDKKKSIKEEDDPLYKLKTKGFYEQRWDE